MLPFIVQFFSSPAMVVGVIALIGLLLQRRPASEVLAGSVKTVLGFLIISAGADVIVRALTPIQEMFLHAFHLVGFVPFDELVVGRVTATLGRETALILGLGFLGNVLLARLTPFKYIYLTGHMIWVHAGMWALLFRSLGFTSTGTIVAGTIVQALYTTLMPALAQPIMRRVTGSDDIAFGHGQTVLAVAGAYIARLFGRPGESAEQIRLSDRWSFFRDMAISMSLIMLLVTLAAALFAGPEYVTRELSEGQNPILWSILQALTFTAGVLVLMQGVRTFIGEVVPAFRGIADKLVPGARPALDCPVIFPYAPNSLIIGLIAGTIAQAAAIALIVALRWPVPIPSMIVAFFASGTGAIFGNALAGRRGAIFGGFFWSFAGFLLAAWAYQSQLYGDLTSVGATGVGFIVPDGIVISAVIRLIVRLIGV